jgi:hypothetical protein
MFSFFHADEKRVFEYQFYVSKIIVVLLASAPPPIILSPLSSILAQFMLFIIADFSTIYVVYYGG